MQNKEIVLKMDIEQLNWKIWNVLADNGLLTADEENVYMCDRTVIEKAILTLYKIAVIDEDFDRIITNPYEIVQNNNKIILSNETISKGAGKYETKRKSQRIRHHV